MNQKLVYDFFADHQTPDSGLSGVIRQVQMLAPQRVALVTQRTSLGDRKLIVKDIRENTHQKQPEQLLNIQRNLIMASCQLRECIIKILVADPQRGWIVMEHLPAPTLETTLSRSIRTGHRDDLLRKIFRELANLLNAFGQTRADAEEWRNAITLKSFEVDFAQSSLRSYLPRKIDTLEKFYACFSSSLFFKSYRCWVPVDCQPKNILVDETGSVRLVDPDYSVGNPALAAAHFLISLDRIGLRRPFPQTLAVLDRWKSWLATAFLEGKDQTAIEELLFLYPSTLFRVCRMHVSSRPMLKTYLRWYYGNRLRHFINRLSRIPRHRYAQSVQELFSGIEDEQNFVEDQR